MCASTWLPGSSSTSTATARSPTWASRQRAIASDAPGEEQPARSIYADLARRSAASFLSPSVASSRNWRSVGSVSELAACPSSTLAASTSSGDMCRTRIDNTRMTAMVDSNDTDPEAISAFRARPPPESVARVDPVRLRSEPEVGQRAPAIGVGEEPGHRAAADVEHVRPVSAMQRKLRATELAAAGATVEDEHPLAVQLAVHLGLHPVAIEEVDRAPHGLEPLQCSFDPVWADPQVFDLAVRPV